LPIRTYAVFCLFASREKEGEIFKIHYIKFKTNDKRSQIPLKIGRKRDKNFQKKRRSPTHLNRTVPSTSSRFGSRLGRCVTKLLLSLSLIIIFAVFESF